MNRQELFTGERPLSKLLLGSLATLLSFAGMALMLSLLLLGGGRTTVPKRNPLVVQAVPEIPPEAELTLEWEADKVVGTHMVIFKGTTVAYEPDEERAVSEGVSYQVHTPLPATRASCFINPRDFNGWIRIMEPPPHKHQDTLTIQVRELYLGGSPCAFEVYCTKP